MASWKKATKMQKSRFDGQIRYRYKNDKLCKMYKEQINPNNDYITRKDYWIRRRLFHLINDGAIIVDTKDI